MNHHRRQFNRAALSRKDFREAREFLKEVKPGLTRTQEESFLMSAVIFKLKDEVARTTCCAQPNGSLRATRTGRAVLSPARSANKKQ